MSTMIALFLVLSTLASCAGETLTNVRNALPPSSAAIVLSVETEPCEDSILDEDGTLLAEYAYELPVLRVLLEDGSPLETVSSPDQEQALAIAAAFNSPFNQWRANARNLAESAKAEREFRREAGLDPVVYTDNLWCSVYQTEHLISVSGYYSTFTGGAHPNSILVSWNFDLDTGEFFEPEILDEDGGFQAFVQEELILQAKNTAGEMGAAPEDFYWKDYEDTLADWSSYAVSFDEEGMTVGFSPYELACYAAGPQVFRLSYETLRPHLSQSARDFLGL